MGDNVFSTWPLGKKYHAAVYYLKHDRCANITDAQRSQLSAVHLQLTYGNWSEGMCVDDFTFSVGGVEQRRREEEWKKLRNMSRAVLMRKFLSVVRELCPRWYLFKRLYDDFEMEWIRGGTKSSNVTPRQQSAVGSARESPGAAKLRRAKFYGNTQFSLGRNRSANVEQAPLFTMQQKRFKQKRSSVRLVPSTASSGTRELEFYSPRSDYELPKRLLKGFEANFNKEELHQFRQASVGSRKQKRTMSQDFEEGISDVQENIKQMGRNHSMTFGNNMQEFLEQSMHDLNTELFVNLIKPKFEILGSAIAEVDDLFHDKYYNWSDLMTNIRTELSANLDLVFQYLEQLSSNYIKETASNLQSNLDRKNVLTAFDCIKEIHDPANDRCKLYGVTKLQKSAYKAELENCRSYFKSKTNEMFDYALKLESIFEEQELRIATLQTEVQMHVDEQDKFEDRIRAMQETAYRDQIELSNMVKNYKRSVGLIHGSTYESRLSELERENEELRKLAGKRLIT